MGRGGANYGTRRGSVSHSYMAYRVEYTRTNAINHETNEHAIVVYARTDAEAERKAGKRLANELDARIVRIWNLDKTPH